jgi:hypothetical protein
MKHFTSFIFSILLFFMITSCSEKKLESNSISSSKMSNIIADLQLVQAAQNYNGIALIDTNSYKSMRENIFKKYNINKNQFDNALAMYSNDSDTLKSIYDNAIEITLKKGLLLK